MKGESMFKRILRPLQSRKVRIALATVLAAYFAEFGLQVGETMILTILGTGVALILGVAHEDAGRFIAGILGKGRNE